MFGHRARRDRVDGGGPERLGGHRRRARQHDVADVEGAEHGRQCDAEVLAGAAEDGGAVGAVGPEASAEQRLGHLGLEAPTLAAGAQRAVGVDDDVADLAGRVRRAGEQPPVEHEPGADALVDADADQVVGRSLAERQLGQRGGVGVVDDGDGQVELAGEVGAERQRRSTRGGRRSRRRRRRRRCRGSRRRCRATAGRRRRRDRRRCASRASTAAAPGPAVAVVGAPHDDLAGEIDDGADELRGLGEVEAEDVPAVGADADERRRLADAAVGAQPELLDDSVVEQLTDDRRDAWPA